MKLNLRIDRLHFSHSIALFFEQCMLCLVCVLRCLGQLGWTIVEIFSLKFWISSCYAVYMTNWADKNQILIILLELLKAISVHCYGILMNDLSLYFPQLSLLLSGNKNRMYQTYISEEWWQVVWEIQFLILPLVLCHRLRLLDFTVDVNSPLQRSQSQKVPPPFFF